MLCCLIVHKNKILTPELISDTNTGKYLHRFSWLDDNEIGTLSHEWVACGLIKNQKDPLHYTRWSWFEKYKDLNMQTSGHLLQIS